MVLCLQKEAQNTKSQPPPKTQKQETAKINQVEQKLGTPQSPGVKRTLSSKKIP